MPVSAQELSQAVLDRRVRLMFGKPRRVTMDEIQNRRIRVLTRQVKELNQGTELKFQDNEIAATAILAGTGMTGLELNPSNGYFPALAQEDNNISRLGREAVITNVHLKGIVQFAGGTVATKTQEVLVLLVQDKRMNGATLNSEDVLVGVSNAENNTSGFRDLSFRKKFTVLAQRRFLIQPLAAGLNASVITDNVVHTFTMRKKLNMKMRWADDTNDSTACQTNSLNVIAVSTQTGSTLAYKVRCTFRG